MAIKKWFVLSGILALIGTSVFLWKSICFEPKLERIIFSNQKYPIYQNQVVTLLNKGYHGVSVSPSDIAIALTDLNDDNVPEVIAFSLAGGISGAGGGYTGFYCQTPSGLKLLSDSCLTAGSLYKSTHKTNGYNDIVSYVVGWKLDHERDRKLLLVWNKKDGYDYTWMKKISPEERERELKYGQNL